MTLDVVLCTYNRSALLRKAILSVLDANLPATLRINFFVVDNNSPDNTADVVRSFQAASPFPLHYICETKQGSSHARNAGIMAGNGELVAMFDDDEEITSNWFEVIVREFQDPAVHFIGGPVLPNWQAPAPTWLPPGYYAVIGAIPAKKPGRYSTGAVGMLSGGNAVVRRTVFDTIGSYSGQLGRTNKGLTSEEDTEFFRRALKAGFDGLHVPDLAVLHFVPAERLTRNYHRRWAFWRAVSQGFLDRSHPEQVTYLFGVPRHRIGRSLRGAFSLPRHFVSAQTRAQAFADELAIWDLLGFVHGRFLHQRRKQVTDN